MAGAKKAGMGAETPEVVMLTEDERRVFLELVDLGRRMAYDSSRERLAKAEADGSSEATVARYGRMKRKRERELDAGLGSFDPDRHVGEVRLLLLRHAGATARMAERQSGSSFAAVEALKRSDKVFDQTWRAVENGRRSRMLSSSVDTLERAIEGGEVNAVSARAAEWAAERLDREVFGDRPASSVSVGIGGGGGGGLVINLVQAALPVQPQASIPVACQVESL